METSYERLKKYAGTLEQLAADQRTLSMTESMRGSIACDVRATTYEFVVRELYGLFPELGPLPEHLHIPGVTSDDTSSTKLYR